MNGDWKPTSFLQQHGYTNNQGQQPIPVDRFQSFRKGPPKAAGGRGGAGAGVVRSPQKPKRLTDERNKQTPFGWKTSEIILILTFGWKTPLIFNV